MRIRINVTAAARARLGAALELPESRRRRRAGRPVTRAAWVPLVAVVLGAACGAPSAPDAGPDTLSERKREVLASLAANVLVPTLRDFAASASALEIAASAYAADPADGPRAAAQAAWSDAIDVWQRAELMQLGPAGMSGTLGVAGGMDLRDEIYSWPTTSTCQIDQRTIGEAHGDPELLAAELVDARGLDALEYLLFVESDANTCSTASPINADGTWAGFTPEQIRARRARYAHSAAVLVAREATRLLEAWETGFSAELSSAGDGSAVFDSAQAALNDLAGAMLYIDNELRDMKVGEPAGIVTCPTPTCPESLESRFAAHGRVNVLANTRAFELLFLGGAPSDAAALGLDDLLVDLGQEALAARVRDAIAAAIVAVEAIGADLSVAIETEPAAVMAAYDALGLAQRLFKVDVVTALDLEPSTPRVGDND